MSFSIGYDDGYKCMVCNKMYELDDASSYGWKCPVCGEYIRIAAKQLCTGHIKIRKKAQDVKRWDIVNLAGVNEIYFVLGITELSNGKLSMGLKNYGPFVIEKDKFVDVVEGAYYESDWDM